MGLLTFLTPYKKYGVAVALLAAAYGGYHYRDLSADKAEAQYKQETLEAVVAAQTLASAYVKDMQTMTNKLEEQSYENQKKRDSELAYYRNLVESLGGLHDPYGQAGDSPTTGGSSGNQTTTSGAGLSGESSSVLSKELTIFLLEQANLADRVVDQFLMCQDYVNKLTEATNGN